MKNQQSDCLYNTSCLHPGRWLPVHPLPPPCCLTHNPAFTSCIGIHHRLLPTTAVVAMTVASSTLSSHLSPTNARRLLLCNPSSTTVTRSYSPILTAATSARSTCNDPFAICAHDYHSNSCSCTAYSNCNPYGSRTLYGFPSPLFSFISWGPITKQKKISYTAKVTIHSNLVFPQNLNSDTMLNSPCPRSDN
jgi:hypothetical protein